MRNTAATWKEGKERRNELNRTPYQAFRILVSNMYHQNKWYSYIFNQNIEQMLSNLFQEVTLGPILRNKWHSYIFNQNIDSFILEKREVYSEKRKSTTRA